MEAGDFIAIVGPLPVKGWLEEVDWLSAMQRMERLEKNRRRIM